VVLTDMYFDRCIFILTWMSESKKFILWTSVSRIKEQNLGQKYFFFTLPCTESMKFLT